MSRHRCILIPMNAKNLPDDIYDYYCTHFDTLSYWKQIHFSTRLAHWRADPFCVEQLKNLRTASIGETGVEATLKELYDRYVGREPEPSKNAAELRLPYFQKYPELRAINVILFRALVYMKSYDIDCRPTIYELFPDDTIGTFLTKLFQDEAAVAILSTHAINAQYLYRRLISETDDTDQFDPADIYQLGQTAYDFTDKTHLKLYIYLYTHCIIGESVFYTRHIPEKNRDVYLRMISAMEKVIDDNFENINLDNKCEFLACCQIVGVESRLRQRIESECSQSISPEGTFLVDTLNKNPQTDSVDFNKSEHRNVLYIMANSPYRPFDIS